MAREVVTKYVSDLTGENIEEGKGISITIKHEEDPDRPWHQVDASEDDPDVVHLMSKAREIPKRGRAAQKKK